jgi:hypothetical protein
VQSSYGPGAPIGFDVFARGTTADQTCVHAGLQFDIDGKSLGLREQVLIDYTHIDVDEVNLIRARFFREDICRLIAAGTFDIASADVEEKFLHATALVKSLEKIMSERVE